MTDSEFRLQKSFYEIVFNEYDSKGKTIFGLEKGDFILSNKNPFVVFEKNMFYEIIEIDYDSIYLKGGIRIKQQITIKNNFHIDKHLLLEKKYNTK